MMSYLKDFDTEEGMSEVVAGGAALAWRLLATLEGGSLALATSALFAYTIRNKIRTQNPRRVIRNVLVTNTTSLLGKELKRRLESHGCTVELEQGTSGAKVDAIVVVGAEPKADGLDGMASLVNEDVYNNLKLLETLSSRVRWGGCISWACTGDASGAYSNAGAAFDNVLQASLQHVATVCQCEPIWVGRCESAERAAELVVAALLTRTTPQNSLFSMRNIAHRVGAYVGRWLKIIS